jgi:hypothetical protein
MKKPRRKKTKRHQRTPAQPARQSIVAPLEATILRTSARRFWACIAAVAVILGLPGSVFALWPRMTLSISGPFDDANAYSRSFTVTNTSFIALRNLNVMIGFCAIEVAKGDLAFINNCNNDAKLPRMFVGDMNWRSSSLGRDEPFTVTLTDELTTSTEKYRATHPHVIGSGKTISALKGANAVLVATFQPWVIPCWSWISEQVCVKRFRIVAEEQPNGKVMWRSVPLDWRPTSED